MAVQVSELVAATILQAQRTGYIQLSMSNYTNTTEPVIKQGSLVEVSGALFQSSSDDSISGLSGLSDGTVYIKGVVSGSTLAYSWTATAPTWFDTKQGWYDGTGTDRYVGGGTKSGASVSNKWIYHYIYNNQTTFRIYGNGNISTSGSLTTGDVTTTTDLSRLKVNLGLELGPFVLINQLTNYPVTVHGHFLPAKGLDYVGKYHKNTGSTQNTVYDEIISSLTLATIGSYSIAGVYYDSGTSYILTDLDHLDVGTGRITIKGYDLQGNDFSYNIDNGSVTVMGEIGFRL